MTYCKPNSGKTPDSSYTVFREILDTVYLAWDDDGGQGSDAALKFPIPADGDYIGVAAGSRQPVGPKVTGLTFGDYRLTIGVNAPQVLTGRATPTGAGLAQLEVSPRAGRRRPLQSSDRTPRPGLCFTNSMV